MSDLTIIFHIACPKCGLQAMEPTRERITVADLQGRSLRMRVQFLSVDCIAHLAGSTVSYYGGRTLPRAWEFNAELPPFWNNNGDVFR